MALKKPTVLDPPPPADPSSSSSEEEVSNESEEEDDDNESEESEEDEQPPQPKPSKNPSPPPAAEKKKPHFVIKPSAPKPVKSDDESDSEPNPPAPDPSKSVTVAVPVPSAKKRATDSKEYTKKFKKLKEVAAADDDDRKTSVEAGAEDEVKKVGEDGKKQLFLRLFSEEDEIELLKGMLRYSSEKGVDPIGDLSGFHEFVKGAIHVDVTTAQLSDKVRRMRKKYLKNAKKGDDRKFGKPHEQLSFDLSKKLWGGANVKEVSIARASTKVGDTADGEFEVKSNGKGKRTPKPSMTPDQKEKHASSLQIPIPRNEKEHVSHNESSSSLCLTEMIKSKDAAGIGLSEEFFKKGLELLGDEVKAGLEEKWKSLVVAEAELYYRRLEITHEQVKLTLDAFKTPQGNS